MKTRNSAVALLAIWLSVVTPLTTSAAEAFPNLKTVEVPKLFEVAPSLEPFKIRVHYDPAISVVLNKRERSEEDESEYVAVLETKIDRNSTDRFTVFYSPGGSADPSFSIVGAKGKASFGPIPGLELFLPGNGSVYVMGHTNNYFNRRQKFILKEGKLVETKQPFYFVGLEARAKRDITIFADKAGNEAVASLPASAKLTVLVNDGDYYLIKTTFGLLGWLYADPKYRDDLVEGLYFRGD